jgi:hypothetical protein
MTPTAEVVQPLVVKVAAMLMIISSIIVKWNLLVVFVTLQVVELHSPVLVINWLIFLPYHLQWISQWDAMSVLKGTSTDFCEEQQKEINAKGENRHYYKSCLRYIQGNTNVRKWYHEWMDRDRKHDGEQLLTLSESTYGIATNIGFHCNKCNGILVPIEAKRTLAYKETKSDYVNMT